MRLVRYNPLNEMALFRNSFNNFFTDPIVKGESKSWYPAVDIMDKGDSIVLMIDLPGVLKEDISVNLEEKVLTISGERKSETNENEKTFYRRERSYGNFSRSFTLAPELLTKEVDAGFNEGVLTITLKKNQAKEEVKKITIH